MKTFKIEDYTINVCTDTAEWEKEFYNMPEGAILEVDGCMGVTSINDKEIWVFVPPVYDIMELKRTIAHEVGHIIEFNYPKNIEQIDGNDELHELKANHYSKFYMVTDDIVNAIIRLGTVELVFA